MVAYAKFNVFVQNLAEKVHDLGADTLKIALTSGAPAATNEVRADLTEIASGGGYVTGGSTVTITTSTQTGGTYRLVGTDVVFTGVGTTAVFRYAVLYNDTPASPADPLIGYWDYGSNVTLLSGETFTVDLDPAGILTIV